MDDQLDLYTELIKRHAYVAFRKIKKPPKLTLGDLVQEGSHCFLVTKHVFYKEQRASFKTFLTRLLRQHFNDIVTRSYRHKEKSICLINDREKIHVMKHKLQVDPAEIVHVSFLLNDFTADELEYVEAMLQSIGEKRWSSRRGLVRKKLGITYNREVEMRNSLADKVRK